jgi:serine/threonine protein phosphatase PrpC
MANVVPLRSHENKAARVEPARAAPPTLRLAIGQHSEAGRKTTNQDFHGALIPEQPLLTTKGVVVAIADGVSSSEVGHIAAQAAIKSFLTDYYCTSEAWSVRNAATRVLAAANSWLHAETRRAMGGAEAEAGYVSTFSAIIFKSATAHLVHVGDSRVQRLAGASLEQLTQDHRLILSAEENYLDRALGARAEVEIDYQSVSLAVGDVFVLTTDGVHDWINGRIVADALAAHADDLDAAARRVVRAALANGSSDNLTVQIVRVDSLPDAEAREVMTGVERLPLPPLLEPRMRFDGHDILRRLHGSSRSHLYLARDSDSGELAVLKLPSIALREDDGYLRRFMLEDWIAQRIDSPHVLKPSRARRPRGFLYVATEFIDGQTLAQWMVDNPAPDRETVRGLVEQIARGLLAFHRKEMLHQDLRPENIMIDRAGTVKIIDFGSTRVAGVAETWPPGVSDSILGTAQYTAPEYFRGEAGSTRSDLFSLGVIAYQMLTGRLPYGAEVARTRTRAAQGKLRYMSASGDARDVPDWMDRALEKAVAINPADRHAELSEFLADLRRPNEALERRPRSLMERNPLLLWKATTLTLLLVVIGLLFRLSRLG